MSASLALRGLTRRYGAHLAVDGLTLDVAPGELLVLLGPSGCGKTTTLRMVAGFVEPSGGAITLDGQDVTRLPPHRREMGIVFQSYALFPHLSVERNVAFGLEMRNVPKAARATRVAEMLQLVKLEPYAGRLPRQLSGGQQQRVAIARALAIHPRLLLLDEPLSNLDAALRQEVAREMRIMQRDSALTTVMVTHDQDEAMAMAMADRLVVMRDGRVEQVGRQEDLYERPASPFVAGFIGHSNLLPGTLRDGAVLAIEGEQVALAGRDGVLDQAARHAAGTRLDLMFTPAAVVIGIVSFNLPYLILTAQSVFEGIDTRLEEAAQGLGAAPSRAFWRVVWPLALPGIGVAGVLCFILGMNAYATPVLLGGPRFHMMAPLLYWEFGTNNNWPFAAALAFVLMGTTLLLTLSANVLIPRRYRA